jgi:hypothetical protein
MSASSTSNAQPDFQQLGCETINRILSGGRLPQLNRPAQPVVPEDVTVRCQRVWPHITMISPRLNGADFAAAVVQAEPEGQLLSFFIQAVKTPGSDEWHVSSSSGGRRPEHLRDRTGGSIIAGGSSVCVGGIGAVPEGGSIRVEMANGDVFADRCEDGCCIVFAPVTSPPTSDDHVTLRYLGPDGAELTAETTFIGDGKPPPGVHPAPG